MANFPSSQHKIRQQNRTNQKNYAILFQYALMNLVVTGFYGIFRYTWKQRRLIVNISLKSCSCYRLQKSLLIWLSWVLQYWQGPLFKHIVRHWRVSIFYPLFPVILQWIDTRLIWRVWRKQTFHWYITILALYMRDSSFQLALREPEGSIQEYVNQC